MVPRAMYYGFRELQFNEKTALSGGFLYFPAYSRLSLFLSTQVVPK